LQDITLNDLFNEVQINPSKLSLNMLGVYFMKTDNFIEGKYFGDLTQELIGRNIYILG